MKHCYFSCAFIALIAFFAGQSSKTYAQSPVLPDGMEILTPEGVELTTNSDRVIFDKDKNLVIAGSKQKGYKVYFTATDSEHGEELWVSDGTKEGTHMVKDLFEGPISSDVKYITRFNDRVVFSAIQNEDDGAQLFISDGTESGTHMVKLINDLLLDVSQHDGALFGTIGYPEGLAVFAILGVGFEEYLASYAAEMAYVRAGLRAGIFHPAVFQQLGAFFGSVADT